MQRFLITGASRGIGRAIAQRLAAKDTLMLLHGRDNRALDATRVLCEDKGAGVLPLVYDFAQLEQVDAMIQAVGEEPLHLLVNNAGTAAVKPVEEISMDEWQRTLAVNVTGPFRLIQKLLPRMPENASIVNVMSVAAKTAFPGWSAYCMSKHAMEGFTGAVREELRERKIRMINIYPAATNTDIWDSVEGDFPREKMMPPEETAEAVAYALYRPSNILVDTVHVGGLAGNL